MVPLCSVLNEFLFFLMVLSLHVFVRIPFIDFDTPQAFRFDSMLNYHKFWFLLSVPVENLWHGKEMTGMLLCSRCSFLLLFLPWISFSFFFSSGAGKCWKGPDFIWPAAHKEALPFDIHKNAGSAEVCGLVFTISSFILHFLFKGVLWCVKMTSVEDALKLHFHKVNETVNVLAH